MAKREITCKVDEENLILVWSAEGHESLTLNLEKMSAGNQTYAALHGMKQRIDDARAKDAGATIGEKMAAMADLIAYYESGDVPWARASKGGGGFKLDSVLVIECMAAVLCNGDIDKANRLIDNVAAKRNIGRDEAVKVWYDTDEIKPEYAVRVARRNAKGNAAAIMAEAEEEMGEA